LQRTKRRVVANARLQWNSVDFQDFHKFGAPPAPRRRLIPSEPCSPETRAPAAKPWIGRRSSWRGNSTAVNMDPAKSNESVDFAKFRDYLRQLAGVQLNQNYGRRVDASDVVQVTLLEAHRNRDRLRAEDSAAVAGWLRSMLTHNITDAVRQMTRDRRDLRRDRPLERISTDAAAEVRPGLAAEQSTPSQYLLRDEMCAELARGLAALPDDQREAIALHHLQGLPLRELARRMNRSEPAVAGLLFRGMKRLRESLQRHVGDR
jgi:RNA polymerase sigma-70 factor (ECF subfamily)